MMGNDDLAELATGLSSKRPKRRRSWQPHKDEPLDVIEWTVMQSKEMDNTSRWSAPDPMLAVVWIGILIGVVMLLFALAATPYEPSPGISTPYHVEGQKGMPDARMRGPGN